MNLKAAFIILSVVLTGIVTSAHGQGFRGAGNPAENPAMLLQRDDVRGDLQITDEQKAKLYDLQQGLSSRFREAMQAGGDDPEVRRKAFENIGKKIAEEVNAILTVAQQTRLKEIAIQLAGFSSATIAEVQKGLAVTDEQKTKISDLVTRMKKASAEAWEKVRAGEIQFPDALDTMKKNQKVLNIEIGKILTQAQKDKLKTLGGKAFVETPEPTAGGSAI